MDISKTITLIREDKRIKQSEIAEKLGIEQSNYSRFEKRGNKLTFEQIHNIAQAMGMTGVELINEAAKESGEVVGNEKVDELEERNKELENKIKELQYLTQLYKDNLEMMSENNSHTLGLRKMVMDLHNDMGVLSEILNKISDTAIQEINEAFPQVLNERIEKDAKRVSEGLEGKLKEEAYNIYKKGKPKEWSWKFKLSYLEYINVRLDNTYRIISNIEFKTRLS